MIRIHVTPRWQVVALATLVAACVSGDGRAPLGPEFAISDAAHSGGTPGFFFLPPMVSQPAVTGLFDDDIATIHPTIVICDVTDGPDVDCGGATPAIRSFTTSSTPAIVLDGEKYKTDWNTKEGESAAGRTYRVHVLGGTGPNRRELGFADVLLTAEPGKVKNLATDETIVLNDGRTLPIHFRIEQGVIVRPGPARGFQLTGLPASLVAGTAASVTVTARDELGQVATGYRGTVTFISSDPQASLPVDYTFTEADGGIHTFADVSFETAGVVSLRASDVDDAELFGEVARTVGPGAAASLILVGIADPASAGVSYDLRVTARDAFENTATGYTGTVQLTSGDPAAALPAAYQFQSADAGVHTFTGGATFKTAGEQSLIASDGTLSAALSVIVQPAAAAALRFTTQPSDALEDTPIVPSVVVTAYDAFDNVAKFTGAVTIATGANPAAGVLSGTLQRGAVLGVVTFDDLSLDRRGAGYTLVAMASGVTGATSDAFDITAVAPTEVRWINVAGGAWSVRSNWSTGTPPTAEQNAFIDRDGTYTVTLDVDVTVNQLTLGASSGVQTLTAGSGRALTLSTSGTILSTGRMTLTGAAIQGSGILTNAGGTLSLSQTSTINTALVNAGTLAAGVPPFFSTSTINGTLTTLAGSLVRVHAGGSNSATLTVANGFTNHGTIELTKSTDQFGEARLTVATGSLINASDGTIRTLVGSGGTRTLTVQLDNQGTVTLAHPLTINRGSADHANRGLIQVSGGNLTLTQSGTTPSFTNTGTVTVAAGRTLAISGGSFTQSSDATLDGGGAMSLSNVNPAVYGSAFTLGALTLNSSTASFAADVSTETMTLSLTNSTLDGPGTLTNAAGRTLSLSQTSTINTALVNAGTLAAGVPPFFSTSTINGTLTTLAGSLVRVHAGGSNSATLTVANGFTNHGTIELTKSTDQFGEARLTVATGSLINASDGTIRTLVGSGGTRTLTVQLDNQGTVTLAHPLTINRASAQHTSGGTITVNGGDLTVTQSGTSPGFSNAGLIDVATARTMRFTGGTVTNQSSGLIQGAGTFESGTTTAFSNAGSVTATLVRVGGGLSGAGSFAPVTAEFFGSASGIPVGANYAYTNVRVLGAASFAGAIEIPGNLTVAGAGNLTIGGHEVLVEGDFATQNTAVLTMQNALGRLNVRGNVSFGGGSTNTRLTAGTLRVGGNFAQAGSGASFAASGTHQTRLDGVADQTVLFGTPGAATTASHFARLEIEAADGAVVTLISPVFANGQLGSSLTERVIRGNGFTLQAAGLSVFGLVFDSLSLRVVAGSPISQFNDVTFRNMDPTVTQLRLDRQSDVVTFNNTRFETVPTTGFYLHLVDTDLAALFTVTMAGTQPANHGGRIIESVAGQLLGWPL